MSANGIFPSVPADPEWCSAISRHAIPARPVIEFDGASRELAKDLRETMHAGAGNGITARSSRNVRQPNHVLANRIAGHKAERRPRGGEEWLAATKHDGVNVESILINKTKVG